MIWSILKKHWELAATKIKSLFRFLSGGWFFKILIGVRRGPAVERDGFILEGGLRASHSVRLRELYRIHAASEPLK
mgnify:CR=1 FL=1